jgi:hypothetical protein
MNNIYVGKVLGVSKDFDKNEFVIDMQIPDFIDSVKAFPMFMIDEPKKGDEVIAFNMNPNLNNVFIYLPMRKFKEGSPFNGFRYNGFNLEVHSDGKVNISNQHESLYKLLLDFIKILVKVKITGKTFDPKSIANLNRLAIRFSKLLK